jgi:phage-related baseplate assembly protein
MLPTAQKGDLDQIGAHFGTERMDGPDGRLKGEDDDRYRKRIQLALEAFSTTGPYGAYVYHAMKASPKIKDVAVYGPESGLCTPGQALNVILTSEGDGAPSQDIIDAVHSTLNANDVRPLTDEVLVVPANITLYAVDVTLYVPNGPDIQVVKAAAEAALDKYTASRHIVGKVVAEAGLKAAAFVGGVEKLVLHSPLGDIDPGMDGAAYCTGILVDVEVLDDDS